MHRDVQPLVLRWVNDFEVMCTFASRLVPRTWESVEADYTRVSTAGNSIVFTVYERATLRPIGSTGLHDIDHLHRTAELDILIGEKDCWGKGYGTEIARLMLDYAFTVLGLHNVMASAYSYNERSIRLARHVGFREIGRRRQAHRRGGHAYDLVLMDCLATESQGTQLHELLPE